MFQRALIAVFALALTYAVMTPLVAKVGQSLNQSAAMVEASTHMGN